MDTSHSAGPLPVGHLLRDWRRRRHLTQLELAELADTSTRHVSFIETGRSLPSRAMLMRLADRLAGRPVGGFWRLHTRLEAEYDRRLPR